MSDPGVAPASRQATAPDADLRPVDKRWIALFALSWFGVWIAQLTPIQLLPPRSRRCWIWIRGPGSATWWPSGWCPGSPAWRSGGITLLVCAVGFVLRMPDEVLPASARPPLTFGAFVRRFWVSPREHPDFGWTLGSRVLVNIANALTTTLLLYFLEFGLGMAWGPAQSLLVVVIAIYSITSVVASLLVGRLSDRAGKRKRYVIITALLQSVAGLILIIAPGGDHRGDPLLFVFVVVFAAAGALALLPVRRVD